ncbi:hypothetical protein C8R43DRAFT_1056151 [Mycena crocata]|nr:hypothetical protein C8R43DRAFT_1056151 [Mycena crocata]
MSSPPPTNATISATDLAAAAERRLQQHRSPSASELQFSGPEHELRQKFRRLIDPGILRHNSKEQALASLKVGFTGPQANIDLYRHHFYIELDCEKFKSFKPTNTLVKRNLIDPKGTVEYARDLGFFPEVRDFQPYYTFNPRKKDNLRIGADMLREALALVSEKDVRAAQSKREEKAVADAAAEKIRLAYEDDRKMKLLRDQLEKERRDARIAAATRIAERRESTSQTHLANEEDREIAPDEEEDSDDDNAMPGSGNVLGTRPAQYQSSPSNKKTD